MDKEILNQATAKLLEYAQNAEAFASEQIPPLCEEIIRFGFWEHLIGAAIPALAIIVGICGCLRFAPRINSEFDRNSEVPVNFIAGIVSAIVVIGGTIATLESGIPHAILCIKTTVSPRMYLLEYLGDLVK